MKAEILQSYVISKYKTIHYILKHFWMANSPYRRLRPWARATEKTVYESPGNRGNGCPSYGGNDMRAPARVRPHFPSEAKFEIEAKISFRLEAKKKPDFT